jgi:hypothetical protein
MAMLGLWEAPAQPISMDMGGAVWPFVYPKTHKAIPLQVRRTRRAREADLLWMHQL